MDIIALAQKHGIRIGSGNRGAQKTKCPKCSDKRANTSDPCLSVRIDQTGIGWRCFHCGWTGGEMSNAFRITSKLAHKKADQRVSRDPYGDILRKARKGWAIS